MGLLRQELGKPRWSGGGLVLLLVLFPLLLYPIIRNRDISHPLSAQMHLNVCAMIPVPSKLPPPWHTKAIDANGNLICEFRNDTDTLMLSVFLATTRNISIGGAQRTSKAYEIWIKETKASGAQDMKEQVGPWAMAQTFHYGAKNQMLIEDHGVMLYFDSNALDDAALVDYAKNVAIAFRVPDGINVSTSASAKH